MTNIYNEIYGLYYFMIQKILERSYEVPITLKEINKIVCEYGFSESSLYFTPEVTSQGEGYNLLKKSGEGYTSLLKSRPVKFLTDLQKSFLNSMLADKKISLFLDDNMRKELNEAFSDVVTLFNVDDIVLTETALDSDDYSNEKYTSNFRAILSAIKNNNTMRICFNNSRGERKTMKLVPHKLEYGIRDDKFRLCGVNILHEKPWKYARINLSRILSITVLNQSFNIDFEHFISIKRKSCPIEIEVSNARNGFERIFIGLSNYERISSFNEETEKCTIKIYYNDDDEQELLILLLSFGPVIKVLGPEDFKNRFVERIRKQVNML
jgi:predicted DNA-binding transcriptional regulator YafY